MTIAAFLGEDDEDALGDVLGEVRVAGLAEGGGVDKMDEFLKLRVGRGRGRGGRE
jgi:hypothetical protein